ncbi:DUF2937 family protein [Afifella sp. IM 167]|uniref:DUF2937 family protein n=1 Tax=Afifella sp. IM 167 TaxID=2033586 RepID=UPI001CC928C9|nr:DUF2937 family protein [Afifella sp. IM 167]MBZ8132175.1 hypothetical protein [Afifella sp. IM 167]
MAVIRRTSVVVMAIVGGLAGSQAPEFAQQYRQRLGGAVEEMQAVVADFDQDARRSGLDREEALDMYARSPDTFLHDRGSSMSALLARFSALVRQREELETADPALRPVVVLRRPDPRIVEGAWRQFELGVPVTTVGAIWTGIGVLVLGFLTWIVARVLRLLFIRRVPKGAPGSRRA